MFNHTQEFLAANTKKAHLEVNLSAVANTIVEITHRGEQKFTLHLPTVTDPTSIKIKKIENFFGRDFEKSTDELGTFIYFEI